MNGTLRTRVCSTVAALRERAPLVHALTGTVTQALVADGLLAAGARPMMTETKGEAPTLVAVADALLVNLGSLSGDGAEGFEPTVEAAARGDLPWVLDPAAVGLAPVRTPMARRLLAMSPTAVRGNASEILALADGGSGGRGPDSTVNPDTARGAARELALGHGCVVAVSGPEDIITDGEQVVRVASGRPVLTRVTGTGCLLGGLTAACLAADAGRSGQAPFDAVVAATALLTVAAERAGDVGPGSFRAALLDALDALDPAAVGEWVSLS